LNAGSKKYTQDEIDKVQALLKLILDREIKAAELARKAASPRKKSVDSVSLPVSSLTFECDEEDPLDDGSVEQVQMLTSF
jgi:hypothetical protein